MTSPETRSTVIPDTALVQWRFRSLADDAATWSEVVVPHDAMLQAGRGPVSAGGAHIGWFRGGRYEYRTTWIAPEADNVTATLVFEGIQGEAVVMVNGVSVGRVRGGYTEQDVQVTDHVRWGQANEIVVIADNSAQPASRWYPGSGLYRTVRMSVRHPTHFLQDGIRAVTRLTGSKATLEAAFDLAGAATDVNVTAELHDADENLIAATSVPAADGTLRLEVPQPRLWSAESPTLYTLTVRAVIDGIAVDEQKQDIGLRTVTVDPGRGLRVNGKPVLLRGACIHHDNGILGAATYRDAELRRVRILKDSGFNAIRSSHHPISRELLDACDRLGLYVLDELADYWTIAKTPHDDAGRFVETWQDDVAAMVAKDRNRPSVIMYSLGNEISETGTRAGGEWTREIAEFTRKLDATRPLTAGVNPFLSLLSSMNVSWQDKGEEAQPAETGSTKANVLMNKFGWLFDVAASSSRAGKVTDDAFAPLEIAGYNYGLGRYKKDHRRYPDRVILGTETLPQDVGRAWKMVEQLPWVIGDFVWTGWDYLGETGLGVWVPGKIAPLAKPYPYLIAGSGMIDLIGDPDTSLRLAQAAWGTLQAPAVAVRPMDRAGTPMAKAKWRGTDAVESWSWRGMQGRPAEIEVTSADDQVELVLNGRSLGKQRLKGHQARFSTPYAPGELVAIGYRDSQETARTTLTSAGRDLKLELKAEEEIITTRRDSLIFVTVSIVDASGQREMLADADVELTVEGPAELIAFGSAAPATERSFLDSTQATYRGRALAVLRSTGVAGEILVHANSPALGRAQLTCEAVS